MALIEQLKFEEGTRLSVYLDTRKFNTIGVGHNLDAIPFFKGHRIPLKITLDFAYELLASDIKDTEDDLAKHWPVLLTLDCVRRDACIAMAFQLGGHSFLKFHHMIDALTHGKWCDAYNAAMNSNWAKQTPARAKRVAGQFKTGQYYEVPK